MSWIPLHVHSQYSILEATASIAGLAAKAKAFKLPALSLTDQGNLYGAVEFFKACKEQSLRPILGCELFVAPTSRHEKKKMAGYAPGYPVVLLVKNKKGYQNLCVLSSLAYLEGFYYTPRIDKELLFAHREGLICLSGPLQGRIASLMIHHQEEELLHEIEWYQKAFGEEYFFELQRHRMSEEEVDLSGFAQESWLLQKYRNFVSQQEMVIMRLKELSQQKGIRCVVTNDSRYLEKEDWKAQEIFMNIPSGEPCEIWEKDSYGNPKLKVPNPKRHTLPSREYYFKSSEEMETLFADSKEALHTTLDIANSCVFELDVKSKFYPVFVPPSLEKTSYTQEERVREAELFLRQLCEEGIKKRYGPMQLAKVQEKYPHKDPMQVVRERLASELEIITSKGMCDYLLIVHDFISWAKRQGIPMGPGRGSGAGSIILYLTEITDIEPLRFSLFFERFINPERLSYPDIDVDICMERRAEVIDYTVQKYGKDKVAQIITFGTMKAKMAIKDVGRVLSVPLAKVNQIAKLVPEELNITLEKALEVDPDLRAQYETDDEVRVLIDIAKKLEGSVRNTGIHAAGIIICGDPIIEHIPICMSKDAEMMVTQFSMKPVEAVGMLKIDFLGLKTLTSIQKAVDSLRERHIEIDWVNLPLEDQKTFDLLNQGKTLGVFQLESGGMQDLVKQLHIDKFEEIIAVGALYRPGPMEMIPSFIQRKHGRESLEIDHPLMQDILTETYGIMVYQEQVMQIASRLARYSLGEGDVLRRAMGKKDKEEMTRQREKFRKGALENGIDETTAMRVFDKIEKFASYGFNKSHAAAYGYLTYVTAYLKAHFPHEWMAALMTADRDDLSKVAKVIRECQTIDIAILPPDINESQETFVATSQGVRFAMAGIKGVGEGVVASIVEERKKEGPFTSLYDFLKRMEAHKIGKKIIEHLIEAGCFDFTRWSREQLITALEPMYLAVAQEQKETSRGVISLFSLIEQKKEDKFSIPPVVSFQFSKQELLKKEKELLGFYLGGHPLEDFCPLLQKLSCVSLETLARCSTKDIYRTAFIIDALQVKVGKNQKKFCILTISDQTERLEMPIWSELYEEHGALLAENQLMYAIVQTEKQEGELRLQCRFLASLMHINDTVIQNAELAYDRGKKFLKMQTSRETSAEPSKTAPAVPKGRLVVHVDIDKMRLSHILHMKQLFRAHPGSTPVQIEFFSKTQRMGTVAIDTHWGVTPQPALEAQLRTCPSIQTCLTE